MPPELRRIWFIWILDQLSMHAAFFFIPFSDREWKTVNPDSDSKCNHPSWRKKMILDFCRLLNCSNCLLCFLWICTMIWFYSSLPKGKKKCLTCVTFGILCFNGFALCPVFLRDNTTVSHVCATDSKISQLWVLLALRFIILGHAVCDSYSCIGSLLKQGPPFPSPLYIFLLMVEKARRIVGVESACPWLASVITLDTLIMFICLTLIIKVTALREM